MNLLDLARQVGIQYTYKAATNGGEFASSCPECGGDDRFSLMPNKPGSRCMGTFVCRQCHLHGDTISFAIDIAGWDCATAFKSIEHNEGARVTRPRDAQPTEVVEPTAVWIQHATAMVDAFHIILLNKPEVLKWLSTRGLPLEAVRKYRLGYNPQYHKYERSFFGTDKDVHVSKGLIIPYLVDDQVRRIKIRRDDLKPGDTYSRYVSIVGSQKSMSLYRGSLNRMVTVESELDALALDYILDGRMHVVASGSNTRRPDTKTHEVASECNLIAVAYDNDAEGRKMLSRWQEFYDSCIKYPVKEGKDVGEAFELGVDVKSWIENLLK